MFSILVSELTPEVLAKAEYWRIFATTPEDRQWADVRHREMLTLVCEKQVYPLTDVYASHVRCFPVSISPDGTDVRLECPRMPDEVELPSWSHLEPTATAANLEKLVCGDGITVYWRLTRNSRMPGQDSPMKPLKYEAPPTPEHYPRRTCDGVWVWSTRR